MKVTKKILLVSGFVMGGLLFGYSSLAHAEIFTTHREYRVRNELFFNYSSSDLRELALRLKLKAQDFKAQAQRKFNNLLPMQGKSRAVAEKSKEQAAKAQDQQRLRNRNQQYRLSDLRQKSLELAQKRADIQAQIRFDR